MSARVEGGFTTTNRVTEGTLTTQVDASQWRYASRRSVVTTTAGSTSTGTTTKDRTSPHAWAGREGSGKSLSRLSGGGRRSVPHLLLGVLLIVVCAAGGVFTALQLGGRQSVLALARPVAVGQIVSAQDLKQVSIAADSGMDVVPASAASAVVVGHPVAYSLPAGSLVTRSVLGAPQVPPPGKAIAAVGLKPGQFPPDLSPGTTVAVLTTPLQSSTFGTGGQTSSWTAVVTGLSSGPNDQTTVVSLQLSESDARALASASAGQLSLVAIAEGGR